MIKPILLVLLSILVASTAAQRSDAPGRVRRKNAVKASPRRRDAAAAAADAAALGRKRRSDLRNLRGEREWAQKIYLSMPGDDVSTEGGPAPAAPATSMSMSLSMPAPSSAPTESPTEWPTYAPSSWYPTYSPTGEGAPFLLELIQSPPEPAPAPPAPAPAEEEEEEGYCADVECGEGESCACRFGCMFCSDIPLLHIEAFCAMCVAD